MWRDPIILGAKNWIDDLPKNSSEATTVAGGIAKVERVSSTKMSEGRVYRDWEPCCFFFVGSAARC